MLLITKDYIVRYDAFRVRREQVVSFSADIVSHCRHRAQLSQRQYAARIGITPSYLAKIERGLEPLPPNLARKIIEDAQEETAI